VEQATERLGYVAATGLATGLRKTIDWLRASGTVAAWLTDTEHRGAVTPLRRAA
jgi:hypothetical protein